MTPDAMTAGLWLYTGLAVVIWFLTRRTGLALVALAVAWVPWLLGKDPATARSAVILVVWFIVNRYGWRHLITLATVGGLAFLQLYQRVTTGGWDFGDAVKDAANRSIYMIAAVVVAFWAFNLVKGRGRYVTDRLAWSYERRKLQATQEHRRAMGWGRRGAGKLAGTTRKAITGREPPRQPDHIDQLSQHDLFVHARRAGLKPAAYTTAELRDKVRAAQAHPPGPEPATARPRREPLPAQPVPADVAAEHAPLDAAQIASEPLFHTRESVWRVRP